MRNGASPVDTGFDGVCRDWIGIFQPRAIHARKRHGVASPHIRLFVLRQHDSVHGQSNESISIDQRDFRLRILERIHEFTASTFNCGDLVRREVSFEPAE